MLPFISICTLLLVTGPTALAQLSYSSLSTYKNTLNLGSSFSPATPAYWTNLPHHRRTPFALSPDSKTAYLAYLDALGTDVHVQGLDPSTFASAGKPVTVAGGQEASGLVAQDDGFALLTNMHYSGADAPEKDPVAIVVRYKGGSEAWRTWVGGPPEATVAKVGGKNASPFLAGDLVYSAKAKMYGAYFAITGYGDPNPQSGNGHYADSHEYIDDDGNLKWIAGASAHWGCSHSIGLGFEAAGDAPPYASVCADDHTGIWLNTDTQYMSGPKVSNENATNFSVGEPMGGYSGSYSVLANFPGTSTYIFAWQTRGAVDLVANDWGTDGCCGSYQRTPNHNVAVALLSNKSALAGPEAPHTVGAHDGDTQLNLVTSGTPVDHSNVRVEAFDSKTALLSWEQIDTPTCDKPTYGCNGTYSGTYWQLIGSDGKTIGQPIKRTDVFVSGDVTRMPDGRLCWPYVAGLTWDLSLPIGQGQPAANATQMSFACMSNGAGAGSKSGSSSSSSNGTSSSTASSTYAAVVGQGVTTASAPVVFGTPPPPPPTTLTTSTTTRSRGRPPRFTHPPSWPPASKQANTQGKNNAQPVEDASDDECERD